MTKYQNLYHTLEQRLTSMQAGERLPSIRLLQKEYAVSLATLNTALKLLQERGAIELRPHRGIFKSVSKHMGQAPVLALYVPNVTDCLFAKIIGCYHHELVTHLWLQNLQLYELTAASELQGLSALCSDVHTSAVIYMPTHDTPEIRGMLQRLNSLKPVIQIDRPIGPGLTSSVSYDLKLCSYQATRMLIENGCRRIGLIVQSELPLGAAQRVAGYRQALQDAGLPFLEHNQIVYDSRDITISSDLRRLLQSAYRPDSFFATNAVFLPRLFQTLAEFRLRVPEDIALTTFDLKETMWNLPLRMSHVDESVAMMLQRAVAMAGEALRGQRDIHAETVPCEQIFGDTCFPALRRPQAATAAL